MATDYDCWRESTEKVNVANVVRVFQENVKKIMKIFIEVVPKIAEKNWDNEIDELNVRKSFVFIYKLNSYTIFILFKITLKADSPICL